MLKNKHHNFPATAQLGEKKKVKTYSNYTSKDKVENL